MGRMVMGDFPCIYESLMMILHHKETGVARHDVCVDWIAFVMSKFMLESSEFQDDCYAGKVR